MKNGYIKLEIINACDGNYCLAINNTRVAGPKPALTSNNIVQAWNVKREILLDALGLKPWVTNEELLSHLKDGKLTISIGIDQLAHAFENSPDNEIYDKKSGEYEKSVKVTDSLEFAKDVLAAMEKEEEDGSSPLTDFLDKMCQAAVDDGSLGVEDKE